ncbi:MAG: Plug domain-containing protein, partial [Candidatus Omnitrophica bacterium]|nr:Plug domain-containing protein [Candidatus Omnitrophota bacterium]
MARGVLRLLGIIFAVASFMAATTVYGEESSVKLDKIVVTPARNAVTLYDAPAAVSMVEGDQIERQNPATIDETLRALPGVDVQRPQGFTSTVSKVSLRGFGTDVRGRTLVLIDGVRFNEIYTGEVYWNAINPKDVERVEVSPGPFSAIYGPGAMGGVINIITKLPDKPETDVYLSYGSFATRSADFRHAFKYKNFSYILSGSAYRTNGYVAAANRNYWDIRRWRESYTADIKT